MSRLQLSPWTSASSFLCCILVVLTRSSQGYVLVTAPFSTRGVLTGQLPNTLCRHPYNVCIGSTCATTARPGAFGRSRLLRPAAATSSGSSSSSSSQRHRQQRHRRKRGGHGGESSSTKTSSSLASSSAVLTSTGSNSTSSSSSCYEETSSSSSSLDDLPLYTSDTIFSETDKSNGDLHDYLVKDLQQQYQQLMTQQQMSGSSTSFPSSSTSAFTLNGFAFDRGNVPSLRSMPNRDSVVGVNAIPHTNENREMSVQEEMGVQEEVEEDGAAIARARWLLLIAAALYGTNFSCVKLLGEAHLPVGASSTVRFGLAALATAPWLIPHSLKEWKWKSSSVQAIVAGLEVGAWNSIGYVAQAVGLETTAASKSAFLCSLAVVVVPLLDYLFKGKVLKERQTVGMILALVGVAILELGGFDGGASGGSNSWHSLTLTSGDMASLVQPLAFGMGFWRMEAAMHQHPHQALRSTAAQLLAVFLGSALYCFGVESSGGTNPTLSVSIVQEWLHQPTILMGLVWTGVITTALTVYMETMALETLSAAETTLIFSTEPLWGTAFAAAVMGEQLGIDSGIGALLIVVGCAFSNLGVAGMRDYFSALWSSRNNNGSESNPCSVATATSTTTAAASGIMASLSAVTNNMWSNVSIAAKVCAIQLEDFFQDIGFLPDN